MNQLSLFIPKAVRDHVRAYLDQYQQAGTVLAFLLVLGGSVHLWNQDISPLPSVHIPLPHGDEAPAKEKASANAQAHSLAEILDRTLAQQGGEALLGEFRTFQKSGVLARVAGETADAPRDEIRVDYAFRRPDLVRYRLSDGEGGVRLGFDGTTSWVQRFDGPLISKVSELDAADAESLDLLSDLAIPAGVFLSDRGKVFHVGETEVHGRPCHVLVHRALSGAEQRFYIDQESFLVVQRSRQANQGPDGPILVEVRYGEFRIINDLPLAHVERVYHDGVLQSSLLLTHFQINPGILAQFFEIPGDLSPDTPLAGL